MGVKTARLLQLTDSAFPLGGFAFSGGLEWMVKSGLIESIDDLTRSLSAVLHQTVSFDLPYMASFWALSTDSGVEDHSLLSEVIADYHQIMFLPLQKKASLAQGGAFLRLVPALSREGSDQDGLLTGKDRKPAHGSGRETVGSLLDNQDTRHFLPLFTLGVRWCTPGISLTELADMYSYMLIRDQLSAAVRLGSIGPMKSVELQSALLSEQATLLAGVSDMLDSPKSTAYKSAFRINPMGDLALSDHENLYAKLFQN